MKEYLGQILSINCIRNNFFEVIILIDTPENFKNVLSIFRMDLIDQFYTYTIVIEVIESGELLLIPEPKANELLDIYSQIEPDVAKTMGIEEKWQKGMILDNLVYDTVNSLLYRPVSSSELELEEIDGEDIL
jgi:hypothetical protein